jgi:hypothetical protein
MTRNGEGDPEPLLALKRAVTAFKDAETLFFEGRKLHTAGPAVIQEAYRQSNLPIPVTRQKYYSWNHAETNYVRVESTVGFEGRNLTTVFIKNSEGIWDVYPTVVCEVSAIFKRDQLFGTFPFLRFFSAIEYHYDLSTDAAQTNDEQFVVRGLLASKPPQCDEDIAKNFSYTISTRTGHLCSLYEKTFTGKTLELVLDTVEINRPVDEHLFALPDIQKTSMSELPEYMNVRMKEWASTTLAG